MNHFTRAFCIFSVLTLLLVSAACAASPSLAPTQPAKSSDQPTAAASETSTAAPGAAVEEGLSYLDPNAPTQQRVEDLLARMSLEEKIGQMTQVEKNSISPQEVTEYSIGSVLSGGGGSPSTNTAEAWAGMVDGFQAAALKTRLGIPLIYGVDAVHGHNNLYGAVVYPHNIGLGAANDPALMEKIGRATAKEMTATGIRWNFAPVVAVVQDIRWGRTYEGYGENTEQVSSLSTSYIRGLQNASGSGLSAPPSVLATPKHFIGDGGTKWGTSNSGNYQIDQGDVQVDEDTLRKIYLPPYQAAIEAGAESIMVSFNSWKGVKMHAQKHLLTNVLKDELGFKGFLVSDWQAVDQIPGDYYNDVVTSINAGLDMIMVPYDYKGFIATLTNAVNKGDVPMNRVDDAVRRILTVKYDLGLFDHPYSDPALLESVGSEAHRALAREAVAKSLVLLKNDNQALPAAKDTPVILLGGQNADNIGSQCGGWTIEWQGKAGDITPGDTLLEAVQAAVSAGTRVEYNTRGDFEALTGTDGKPLMAEIGIAVVGETPYAEGEGDQADLALSASDQALIQRMRARSTKLVVVVISGRPLIITDIMDEADAWVAAWLPGTEGRGMADVLFGDVPFTGKLSYSWPASMDQLPLGPANPGAAAHSPLFPYGYGLGY